MQLNIKVIPGASRNFIKEEEGSTKVYLTATPTDGKANQALIKFLSKHYDVGRSSVAIIKGERSRHKTIEINFEGR